MNPIISVENVTKEFMIYENRSGLKNFTRNLLHPVHKKIVAVQNMNFRINGGEIVGYIGPNGAGKSTTIKMLTGVLVPTSGNIMVFNKVPYKNRKSNSMKIGVVFGQKSQLWWDVPVIESLRLIKEIYRISDEKFQENLDLYSEILNLNELLKMPVRQLSLGQRMRCDLAASLIHEPEILFLDEPTIGLDVGTKDRLRNFIKEMNKKKGITVFLTTHDMQDVEELCSRVMLINHGEKIYDGDLDTIKKKYVSYRILKVQFDRRIKKEQLEQLEYFKKIEVVKEEEYTKWFRFNYKEISVADIVHELLNSYRIIDFSTEEPMIEEVIKQFC